MMHSVCACCRVGRAPAPAFLAPSFFSSDSRCIARRLPEAAFKSFSLVPQSHTIELTRGAQVPHLRFVQIWLDANADFGVIAATTSTFSCGPRSKRATYPTAYSAFERPLLAARRAHRYASLSLCFKTLQEESVYLCGQSREGAHSWLPAATANGVSSAKCRPLSRLTKIPATERQFRLSVSLLSGTLDTDRSVLVLPVLVLRSPYTKR